MDPNSTPDQTRDRRLVRLCVLAPLLSFVVAIGVFLVILRSMPEQWVVHVDGRGNITYGSWWTLFAGAVVLAGLAFVLGQYLARDFASLGHWYPQQKSIVIGCFAFGYAMLGLFIGNMLAALSRSEDATAEASVGYGLLSFVLVAIVAAVLYTWLLPKAQQIR